MTDPRLAIAAPRAVAAPAASGPGAAARVTAALVLAWAAVASLVPAAAQAQAGAQARPARAAAAVDLSVFAMVPAPMVSGAIKASEADVERAYRADAARHLYAAYPTRVFRGQLPPLLFSVMMVETEIDAEGRVVDVHVVRRPAVDAVAPWVVAMIKRAAPFPPPAKLAGNGTVRYLDVWLVDRSGLFQVDTLTEGQR